MLPLSPSPHSDTLAGILPLIDRSDPANPIQDGQPTMNDEDDAGGSDHHHLGTGHGLISLAILSW